jgi:ABC-type phosphate/phosphonate transport system substrate-binding protein
MHSNFPAAGKDMTTSLPQRSLLALISALALGQGLPAVAQDARPLSLAVSEGTSGGIDAATARKKYAPLADRLSAALGRKVEVAFVREFAALEEGMRDGKFDFVIARPSDYPARGLRDYRYQYVANAEPEGHCMLVVRADSPVKSVADLRGKTFVLPEEVAYMTRFCRAELRDKGIDLSKESVFYVREQGAIPFGLEKGIADVGGLASYSGAVRKWRESGQRILHESVGQPYMPVVGHPGLSPGDIAKARQVLVGLSSDEAGQAFLRQLGITGFSASEEDRLRKLLGWLGV